VYHESDSLSHLTRSRGQPKEEEPVLVESMVKEEEDVLQQLENEIVD